MAAEYVLSLKKIRKSFYGVAVLDDVDFELKKASVHALVGGNGAGKSTLMKIINGVYTCSSGTITINGQQRTITSPAEASSCGIRMVYQEFSLVPTLSIAENIFLNQEIKEGPMINVKAEKRKAQQLLEELDIHIDVDTMVGDLDVGYQQLVEIAKAVSRDCSVLILDEPTVALTDRETEQLFNIIRKLKAKGVSVIYISHRMKEIFQIADQISVLRDGKVVARGDVSDFTMESVIRHMIGSGSVQKMEYAPHKTPSDQNMLEIRNLTVHGHVNGASFELKKGEILGIAGLMGSGRTELLEAIFGVRKKQSGEIFIEGEKVQINNVRDGIKHGIVLVPEDRRREGIITIHSVLDNLVLPNFKRVRKLFYIDEKKMVELADDAIKEFSIKTDSIKTPLSNLSGGNQQKVVIAKWLKTNPKVLAMDEPTSGVDVVVKTEMLDIIRAFADSGNSVIMVSAVLTELMAVCDRIIILNKGKISGEVKNDLNLTEEVLQYEIQK